MNDEIKEILDRLDFKEWEVDLYKVPITWCELYDIRDYITNLQKENERLRNHIQMIPYLQTVREKEDYKSRVEKAVEYINKNKKVVSKYEAKDTRLPLDTFMWGVDNLLNILQNGSDGK